MVDEQGRRAADAERRAGRGLTPAEGHVLDGARRGAFGADTSVAVQCARARWMGRVAS